VGVENVENLVKTTMGEIEKVLNTKTVVGESITLDGKTLIPLISIGFGFGAGGGSGKMSEKQSQEGMGEGTGGGGGIRPVAVIINDEKGLRIETIKGGLASALEKMAETALPMMMKRGEKQEKGGQGQSQPENNK
jgi:uncharacterized spore protein YtfJ